MAQQWFVKTKKGPAGPFSPGKIKEFAKQGKIKPGSFIRLDEKHWVTAKSVKGLFPKIAVDPKQEAEPKPEPDLLNMAPIPTPEPTSHLIKIRERGLEKMFGPATEVNHQLGPGAPHIDVYTHSPTASRPFTTLVTGGMSDHAMAIPGQGNASPRCELMMYVDEVEDIYISLLRYLASIPYQQSTWFSYGSTMNNGNPPQPIFEGSVLDNFVFMFPAYGNDLENQSGLSIEGSPLQLLSVMPITTAERKLIMKKGIDSFINLLAKSEPPVTINQDRKCYVKKRGWLGR